MVMFLLMASRHNRWLSLHRDREWVSPILLMKAIAVMLSRWSWTMSPGLTNSNNAYQAALSSSQLMCFLASCSDQVHWKGEQLSVLPPPPDMLASDQIWSVGFGGGSQPPGSPPSQFSHYTRVRDPDILRFTSTSSDGNNEWSLESPVMKGSFPYPRSSAN